MGTDASPSHQVVQVAATRLAQLRRAHGPDVGTLLFLVPDLTVSDVEDLGGVTDRGTLNSAAQCVD